MTLPLFACVFGLKIIIANAIIKSIAIITIIADAMITIVATLIICPLRKLWDKKTKS